MQQGTNSLWSQNFKRDTGLSSASHPPTAQHPAQKSPVLTSLSKTHFNGRSPPKQATRAAQPLPVMLLIILQSPVSQHLPKLQYQAERISR